MRKKQNKIKVLMCGSDLRVGGGMVAVTKLYLNEKLWDNVVIKYVPTHINSNTIIKILYFLYAYIKILWLAVFKHFDIAHLHTTFNGSFYRKTFIMYILQRFGVKVILHHHVNYEGFYKKCSKKQRYFIKKAFSRADMNIILGKKIEKWLKDKAPNATTKIVYNAVPSYEKNPYNANGCYIMFLGWLIDRKGVFDFLSAIKVLDKGMNENIKVVLCGTGDKSVGKRIQELGLEHRIAHIGWVNEKQKKDFFKDTIVNVLPSYLEGLPMTILETMAYGIPNIATNISSIPEVIDDGVTGYLIEPGDIKKLSERMQEIIANIEKRKRLSNASYERIKTDFGVEKHLNCIKDIYERLI